MAIAVLTAGYLGFEKLNYWTRSARIFSYDKDQALNGRSGRGGGRGEVRFDNRERGYRNFNPDRAIPDSLRRNEAFRRPERAEFERGSLVPGNFERRDPRVESGRRDFGRGDARNGKKINLRNVWWFLAVFSGFTVVTIYSDKLVKFSLKKRT